MITDRGEKLGSGSIDWLSAAIFVLLMIIGWMNIYATVYSESAEGFDLSQRYGSQLIWIGISLVAAVIIMFIDQIYFHIVAYPFYAFMMLLLVITLLFGAEVNGAKSWLRLGGFTVQPVEFMKIATALALARYMSDFSFTFRSASKLLMVAAILLLPMGIIVLQNDTGSAIVFFAFLLVFFREGLNPWLYVSLGMAVLLFVFSFVITPVALLSAVIFICVALDGFLDGGWKDKLRFVAGIYFVAIAGYMLLGLFGIKVGFYLCLIVVSLLSIIIAAMYAYRNKLKNVLACMILFVGSLLFIGTVDYVFDNILQLHQQKRILNLLGVESDLQKWGYNVNQSKIAIGSGGLLGKGFMQGTQTKYDFVPEQSTDFIFSTVGEEWGFVGSAVVLGLFCWLIIRLMRMGERQQEAFGRVYCYGVAAVIFIHVIINVGMAVGIMPVIGIPLPLFSYGGSSLLAFTIMFTIAIRLDSGRRELGDGYRIK